MLGMGQARGGGGLPHGMNMNTHGKGRSLDRSYQTGPHGGGSLNVQNMAVHRGSLGTHVAAGSGMSEAQAAQQRDASVHVAKRSGFTYF